MMEVRKRNMHPLPTPTSQFTSMRTDDDISAAVAHFLSSEGAKLQGKTWQDTTADITKWLGSQIQKEREGWQQKTRAALQEIEVHRRDMLKFQGVIQECNEQLKLVVELCNVPDSTIQHIEEQEPRQALPMYIECVAETLNSLMEDRIICLQILRADEKVSQASLPNLLKAYIEALKHHAERAHKEAKSRLESLENANKQSYGEMQKMKKIIHRKHEEVEKLHSKLQEIKEVTLRKFKEVNDIKKEGKDSNGRERESDIKLLHHSEHFERPSNRNKLNSGRHSTPSSLYSAPTPTPAVDQQNIQISEEKLSKLRRSAKKLENSLQDALTQMDTYRTVTKPTKFAQSTLFNNTPPFSNTSPAGKPLNMFPEVNPTLKKEIKLLPSALHTWSTKFEISGAMVRDGDLKALRLKEQDKIDKRQRAKERKRDILQRNQERIMAANDTPTFRSLMKSLDEVKKNKNRSFKPVGQVTKCLRCNKLFTLNDNHKKACNYHPKGKERIEQYSDRGKLLKVSYMWKCCMTGPDNPGCTYGQHV